jgi:hypothetical protein
VPVSVVFTPVMAMAATQIAPLIDIQKEKAGWFLSHPVEPRGLRVNGLTKAELDLHLHQG